MIFSSMALLENVHGYCPPVIYEVLQYFAKITDDGLAYSLPQGKHAIDGNAIYFVVAENMTCAAELRRPETHAAYVDIQYVLAGEEQIGVSLPGRHYTVEEDRIAQDDVAFFPAAVADECLMRLLPGQFLVLFPYEIHRPVCAVTEPVLTRKLIGKVHVSRL